MNSLEQLFILGLRISLEGRLEPILSRSLILLFARGASPAAWSFFQRWIEAFEMVGITAGTAGCPFLIDLRAKC